MLTCSACLLPILIGYISLFSTPPSNTDIKDGRMDKQRNMHRFSECKEDSLYFYEERVKLADIFTSGKVDVNSLS